MAHHWTRRQAMAATGLAVVTVALAVTPGLAGPRPRFEITRKYDDNEALDG